jgi:hypothetical protein
MASYASLRIRLRIMTTGLEPCRLKFSQLGVPNSGSLPRADSARLFTIPQDHVTRLENTLRLRWSTGDVVIWSIAQRSTRQSTIYGNQPRIVRRVTIDGSASMADTAKDATVMLGSLQCCAVERPEGAMTTREELLQRL